MSILVDVQLVIHLRVKRNKIMSWLKDMSDGLSERQLLLWNILVLGILGTVTGTPCGALQNLDIAQAISLSQRESLQVAHPS